MIFSFFRKERHTVSREHIEATNLLMCEVNCKCFFFVRKSNDYKVPQQNDLIKLTFCRWARTSDNVVSYIWNRRGRKKQRYRTRMLWRHLETVRAPIIVRRTYFYLLNSVEKTTNDVEWRFWIFNVLTFVFAIRHVFLITWRRTIITFYHQKRYYFQISHFIPIFTPNPIQKRKSVPMYNEPFFHHLDVLSMLKWNFVCTCNLLHQFSNNNTHKKNTKNVICLWRPNKMKKILFDQVITFKVWW